jgi:hypothetical protein
MVMPLYRVVRCRKTWEDYWTYADSEEEAKETAEELDRFQACDPEEFEIEVYESNVSPARGYNAGAE